MSEDYKRRNGGCVYIRTDWALELMQKISSPDARALLIPLLLNVNDDGHMDATAYGLGLVENMDEETVLTSLGELSAAGVIRIRMIDKEWMLIELTPETLENVQLMETNDNETKGEKNGK